MRIRLMIGPSLLLCASLLLAAPPRNRPDPKGLGATLKAYESPIYVIYTDVAEEDAKEAIIRMNKMAEEYHDRTKALFTGTINQRLPFYLFSKDMDYYNAGGIPKSAGVFNGESLMARVLRNKEGRIGPGTWHVVQHEGFHQFVYAVIRGDIPTWVNEGLAEYFGEGIFTGDGMVTGVIPASRLKRVQAAVHANTFKTIQEMMLLSHADWNADLSIANYEQAWSMVHFLAQGENGKYQDAFAQFLVLVGKGRPWDKAWISAFGSVEGFQQKWKDYWLKMPQNPTLDLYNKAVVASLTSFLGRAYSQKQTFDSFEEFLDMDAKDLKAAPADWLPPDLFTQMKGMCEQLKHEGAQFKFVRGTTPAPQIICVMEDGTRITGTFGLKNAQIGKVTVEVKRK